MKHLKMKKTVPFRWWVVVLAAACMIFFLAVWPPFRGEAQHSEVPAKGQQDTPDTSRRKSITSGNTDKTYADIRAELDRAMAELDKAMKDLNEKEIKKVDEEIKKALKEVDAARIQQEVAKAMASVDMAKIQREVETALKEARLDNIEVEVRKALKEVDVQKVQAHVQKLQSEEFEKQMQQLGEQMKNMKIDIEQSLKQAANQMEHAKAQLELTRQGMDELVKDGIIKEHDPLEIEWKGDTLIINGKEQPSRVSEKYKKYFKPGDNLFHTHNSKQAIK